jgi:formate/nitrite transporter FocA (FNT family)
MKDMVKNFVMTLRSSLFAGIYIGTAGFGFLTATTQTQYGSLFGSILFALGLLAIVGYKLKLYTGTAGFVKKNEVGDLMVILLGNIIGCFLIATLTNYSPIADGIHQVAANILSNRISTGALGCGVLAIGCGLLMTTAVHFARKQNYLPLLFSVPLFIVCGFPHCIADTFYYLTVPEIWTWNLLGVYIATVLGNAIGCNLYRIILTKERYS